jgi:hypothetical protein
MMRWVDKMLFWKLELLFLQWVLLLTLKGRELKQQLTTALPGQLCAGCFATAAPATEGSNGLDMKFTGSLLSNP